MEHHHHHHHVTRKDSAVATLHCLAGCAVGETLGMLIGAIAGWSAMQTIVVAIVLAFFFGYLFTVVHLRRHHPLTLAQAVRIALIADTLSITVMEIVDNGVMLATPGAMDASPTQLFFWLALALSFAVAFVVAWPVNHALIKRGRGHALHHH